MIQDKEPIDVSSPPCSSTLRQMAVFHRLLTSLPTLWIRFGDRALDDVVAAALGVLLAPLAEPCTPESPLNPSTRSAPTTRLFTGHYYLSLLDPHASWFTKYVLLTTLNTFIQFLILYWKETPSIQ